MENIILSQKDADFILLYLRSQLQKLNDSCDKVYSNCKEIKELRTLINSEGSEVEKVYAEYFDKSIQADIEEYSKLYKKQTDAIVRCIELLTIGSTDV